MEFRSLLRGNPEIKQIIEAHGIQGIIRILKVLKYPIRINPEPSRGKQVIQPSLLLPEAHLK